MITKVELEGTDHGYSDDEHVERNRALQGPVSLYMLALEWAAAIDHTARNNATQAGWERIHRFRRGKGGFLGAGADHLLAQSLDLGGHERVHALRLRESDPAHHGGEEEFFEVGEREAFGGLRDARYSLGGEAQGGLQRLVPQADVCLAFGQARQVEGIFAVEAAGAIQDRGVEPFGVIRGGEGDNARV